MYKTTHNRADSGLFRHALTGNRCLPWRSFARSPVLCSAPIVLLAVHKLRLLLRATTYAHLCSGRGSGWRPALWVAAIRFEMRCEADLT
jgi:hypothetical protein